MSISPSHLFDLALERHRHPWNWTLHFASAVFFGLALLFHSYLTLASSFIFLGAGFFELNIPTVDNRWFAFVRRSVEWEKNWVAAPWNRRKWSRFIVFLLVLVATLRALWTVDLATLMLFLALAALWRVMLQNKDAGIDP